MSRNSHNNENGKFDKILSTIWGKNNNLENVGELQAWRKFAIGFVSIQWNVKKTPSEVANLKTMANLAKIVMANLAKIREEFGQKFDEIAR